ncbi:MAG: serine hydrolase [Eubacteriales bacterium]|nr:serine hydrolase [Eubacteriales bacterium]
MENKIDFSMRRLVERKTIAGFGLIIRKNDEIVYSNCMGWGNTDTGTPVRENTIFRLMSMTKLITAVAVMLLVERGKLSLSDNLLTFFPNYATGKGKVTIKHLLNHCSGLGHTRKSIDWYNGHATLSDTLAVRMERIAGIPFDFQPGTKTGYSAIVAFDLLGRIIEIVSGFDLERFFKENILIPLGMTDTGFVLSEEQKSRLAINYTKKGGRLIAYPDSTPFFARQSADANRYFSGAGGLFSTLYDYDRFTRMISRGGELDGIRILKEETVTQMRTVGQVSDKLKFIGIQWGLGFAVFTKPLRLLGYVIEKGTFGWSGAFGTHMFIDPVNRICATLMVNRSNIGGAGSLVSRKVEKLALELFQNWE